MELNVLFYPMPHANFRINEEKPHTHNKFYFDSMTNKNRFIRVLYDVLA